jgi:predicted dehydrogenase
VVLTSGVRRKRFAVCGLSNRALTMFMDPLSGQGVSTGIGDFSECAEVVAIVDPDRSRVEAYNGRQRRAIPAYEPDDFDLMVKETEPDVIAVTGPDSSHVTYILAALGHDINVLTEKPMTVDSTQSRMVLQAEANSKASVRVMHNARYRGPHIAVKRLIQEGRVGRVTNVEMVTNLDTFHGASYFYRWNRQRANSGGLTVTEACHRFDLLNWWLDDTPEEVFAYGALNFYGPRGAHRPHDEGGRPLPPADELAACPYNRRWSGRGQDVVSARVHPRAEDLGLSYEATYPTNKPMYIYDAAIDIEDTYSAVVRYRSGLSVSYSMNASSPWEGYTLAVNGTEGRIETTSYAAPDRCPFPAGRQTITYLPMFGQRQVHEVSGWSQGGGHGDSDERLMQEIFTGNSPGTDGLQIQADSVAGAYAVAVGEAIWRSAASGQPERIADLVAATRST